MHPSSNRWAFLLLRIAIGLVGAFLAIPCLGVIGAEPGAARLILAGGLILIPCSVAYFWGVFLPWINWMKYELRVEEESKVKIFGAQSPPTSICLFVPFAIPILLALPIGSAVGIYRGLAHWHQRDQYHYEPLPEIVVSPKLKKLGVAIEPTQFLRTTSDNRNFYSLNIRLKALPPRFIAQSDIRYRCYGRNDAVLEPPFFRQLSYDSESLTAGSRVNLSCPEGTERVVFRYWDEFSFPDAK